MKIIDDEINSILQYNVYITIWFDYGVFFVKGGKWIGLKFLDGKLT